MRPVSMLALLALLAACAGNGPVATSSADTSTSTSSVPASTVPPIVDCPGVGEFEEGRGVADIDEEASDSRRLGRISWETSDLCETFRFDFETSEGAPAISVPDIEVDHLDSFQVVRISMDVDSAVITDQLVETNLVDRLYVVRSLSGAMFVDLHLSAPAAVRASAASSPARLTLELRPGFVPFGGESVVDDRVVLTSPTGGIDVDVSTQFLGYARAFETNVAVIVTQDDGVFAEADTEAADSLETWGEFRFDLELPPGPVSVFVGEVDAETGGLDGVTVDLTVS